MPATPVQNAAVRVAVTARLGDLDGEARARSDLAAARVDREVRRAFVHLRPEQRAALAALLIAEGGVDGAQR